MKLKRDVLGVLVVALLFTASPSTASPIVWDGSGNDLDFLEFDGGISLQSAFVLPDEEALNETPANASDNALVGLRTYLLESEILDTPEPATVALFGLGLSLFLLSRRRTSK